MSIAQQTMTSSISTPAFCFENLPIELQLAIFDHSDNPTLLNIGKTCHSLNRFVIPTFLKRLGITQPEDLSVIWPLLSRHSDQLSGLTVDFSTVTIKHFVCILDHRQRESLTPITSSVKNIHRVRQLVTRLDSIGSACILFYPIKGVWSLRSAVVEEFLTALFGLLEAIVLKSCMSLQIHHRPLTVDPPYRFQLLAGSTEVELDSSPTKRRYVIRLRDHVLQGHDWRYRQMYTYNEIPSPSPHLWLHSKLTTLDLHSDLLLLPPFSSWTFAIMKQSPITSLSLFLLDIVSKDEFLHYIFPHIIDALPQLQEIQLAAHRHEFLITAITFLPRLPLLRKVTFGSIDYSEFPPTPPHPPQLHLPYLVAFTGFADQATQLLGNVLCPSLSFVNILMDDCTRGRPDNFEIGKQFSILNGLISDMNVTPRITVCFSNHGRQSPLFPMSDGDHDFTKDFSMVSRLSLELPFSLQSEKDFTLQSDYVLGWLGVFRGLSGFTLTTHQPYQNSALLASVIRSEYPNITTFNTVDYPKQFHYHWSTAPNDFRRNADTIPLVTGNTPTM
ncbi:hypothetical protein BDZ97DRAFT_1929860 [Flammula alnicola]|nr:hypothetical protein BDZ97DRAFT_1929860 [Flammula alnicola]